MWNDRYSAEGLSLWARANFDPITLTSMAVTAVGAATSAAGTLAGGNAAKQAGQMTQQMDIQNAAQALASGQRKAFDTQDKTRALMSTAQARAGASGVDAGVGSPASIQGDIAKRGSYHSLMDMFNGQSEGVGLQNQGNLAAWEGDQKQSNSEFAAAGTLAGAAGSMASSYGTYNYRTAMMMRQGY